MGALILPRVAASEETPGNTSGVHRGNMISMILVLGVIVPIAITVMMRQFRRERKERRMQWPGQDEAGKDENKAPPPPHAESNPEPERSNPAPDQNHQASDQNNMARRYQGGMVRFQNERGYYYVLYPRQRRERYVIQRNNSQSGQHPRSRGPSQDGEVPPQYEEVDQSAPPPSYEYANEVAVTRELARTRHQPYQARYQTQPQPQWALGTNEALAAASGASTSVSTGAVTDASDTATIVATDASMSTVTNDSTSADSEASTRTCH